MSEFVRIGVVGSGRIARVHAKAYGSVARGALVACTDVNPDAAKSLAVDFGLTVLADERAMFSANDIDAVLIATPNSLHCDQTIAALAAGKHVFCQKPIAMTMEEANRIVIAAEAHAGQVLQYGFMVRLTPPIPALRSRIVGGGIGSPIASRSAIFGWEPSAPWFYDPKMGGGVILDTMVHFADLLLWLFGPAEYVHADGGPYVLEGAKQHGSADNAVVTVRHKSGVLSSLYVTWTAGHGNFTFEVYGSDGELAVDLVRSQASVAFSRAAVGRPGGWEYPDLVWSYGYTAEQQHFVDRVLGLPVDPAGAANVYDARAALALVLNAQEALDTRGIVRC
jgi:myo-inositol 2-dehydrogenase / D-chiro-inositol 1-dehydrogenase